MFLLVLSYFFNDRIFHLFAVGVLQQISLPKQILSKLIVITQEINEFLSFLAVKKNVTASTQNQALCAIVFLYRHVLNRDIGLLEGLIRAKRPGRLRNSK
jgi:hypothetical protein